MEYEWDADKAEVNLQKHGVAFDTVHAFDWECAITMVDRRWDYGEERVIAMSLLAHRLHVLVFTVRNGGTVRIISLRKANAREVALYEKATGTSE